MSTRFTLNGRCLAAATVLVLTPCLAWGGLKLPTLSIGSNLQTFTSIQLDEPAPEGGLEITLTSEDPSQLLFARDMTSSGSASIVLPVRAGMRETPDFCVHGLGESGTVEYKASSPALGSWTGTVTITPSAIIVMGPYRAPTFRTTPRSAPSRLSLYAVRLDESLRYVEQQAIAGGLNTTVEIESSDAAVAEITPSTIVLKGGTASSNIEFKPLGVGSTTLSVTVPPGFTRAAEHSTITATVNTPGISLTDDFVIGHNLQVRAVVGLGEIAPEGGIDVKLASSNPGRLLLSPSPTEVGSGAITLKVPAGGVSAPVYLQALAADGTAAYTASAQGFQDRTATVTFAPSGVVIMSKSYGPPDEAELHGNHGVYSPTSGIFASLSKRKKLPLAVWTVQLDPKTLRSADVTVQPLRAGASLEIAVQTSDPSIGKVLSPVKIEPGTEFAHTEFTAAAMGSTVISVVTPAGFVKSANSTSITATVMQ